MAKWLMKLRCLITGGHRYSNINLLMMKDPDPYEKWWSTSLARGIEDIVTHWMPLPQPPKGE